MEEADSTPLHRTKLEKGRAKDPVLFDMVVALLKFKFPFLQEMLSTSPGKSQVRDQPHIIPKDMITDRARKWANQPVIKRVTERIERTAEMLGWEIQLGSHAAAATVVTPTKRPKPAEAEEMPIATIASFMQKMTEFIGYI